MENIYLNNCSLFFDMGYSVLPTKGKDAFYPNWQNTDFSTITSTRFKGCNIGLKTGVPSGVICVDIDTFDKELQQKIYALLPPLYSGKVGNKDKGINYFFAYNGEQTETIKHNGSMVVELISTGRQVIIPPSIHPDMNYPYEWIGKSLLDVDELPILPEGFMNEVRAIIGEMPLLNVKATSGRNNKLVEIITAMKIRGESERDIINEIYDYDQANHSPPMFGDLTEKHKEADPKVVAMLFYHRIATSLIRNKVVDFPTRMPSINISEITPKEAPNYKKHKQTHFRGIAQDIFQHIYKTSPVPRSQFSFASTLAVMSTLLGNKIQYQGTFPNLYLMVIGKSGSGKDYPLKFPYKLFAEAGIKHLIGEGSPSSHTSLIHNLPSNKVRLDAVDESSFLFRGMNAKESFTAKMAEIYQTLYTSTGDYYPGVTATGHRSKENPNGRLGECNYPYVNLFCTMTPTDFLETFTTRLMEKGLGGRMMYFVDTEVKLIKEVDIQPIPKHIIDYAYKIRSTESGVFDFSDDVMYIKITPNTRAYLAEVRLNLDKESKKPNINEKIAPILNRKAQLLTKIAIIDACSCQWEKPLDQINLGKDNIDWALKTINANSDNMELFINDYLSGGKQEQMINLIRTVIAEYGGKISKTDLGRKTRVGKAIPIAKDRTAYLNSMKEDGIIEIANDKNTTYYILK